MRLGKRQMAVLEMLAMCENAGTYTYPSQVAPRVGRSLEKLGLIFVHDLVCLTEAGRQVLASKE